MKLLAFVVVLFLSCLASAKSLIDPRLKSFALGHEKTQTTQVLVLPNQVLGEKPLLRPIRYDRGAVVNYYQELSRRTIQPVLESIQNNKLPGVKVLKVFWINGSILAKVTKAGLKNLAGHDGVAKIYKNERVHLDPVLNPRTVLQNNGDGQAVPQPYNFTTTGIDRLYAEQPNIDGTGVTVGLIDTGSDGTHPALIGKIVSFYNGQTHANSDPVDFDIHGTHTSGTIAGGSRQDASWIGVAPGAKLSVAAVIIDYNTMLEGMQWIIDASSNPEATKIKVVSNSWNSEGAPDQELFYKAIATWEGAGVLPVFSAGNNGKVGISHPHEYPGTYSIAASDATLAIAYFSSRGPGNYHGQIVEKPDISAPGVGVVSSVPGGTYEAMDGTSMSCPHVAGTSALLLQVNNKFTPAQLKNLMSQTAIPITGQTAGVWNGDTGFGRLNVYAAVKLAQTMSELQGSQVMDAFKLMGNPVTELNLKSFNEQTMGEVGRGVDEWSNQDTSGWLKAIDIYGP